MSKFLYNSKLWEKKNVWNLNFKFQEIFEIPSYKSRNICNSKLLKQFNVTEILKLQPLEVEKCLEFSNSANQNI